MELQIFFNCVFLSTKLVDINELFIFYSATLLGTITIFAQKTITYAYIFNTCAPVTVIEIITLPSNIISRY
jgi:hypothetical protein